jgi:hypothetical protein
MTKTENLQLPQWEAEDYVQRSDFNEAFAALDEGYSTAMERPYVIGSYTGTGEEMTIELGFRPTLLIVSGSQTAYSNQPTTWANICVTDGAQSTGSVEFTDTGFRAKDSGAAYYPYLVKQGLTYSYIAFC